MKYDLLFVIDYKYVKNLEFSPVKDYLRYFFKVCKGRLLAFFAMDLII